MGASCAPAYTHCPLLSSPLDTAIQLSGGRGRAAEQAYTQRGIIWVLRGEDERALEDFRRAAGLGSHFAQKQASESESIHREEVKESPRLFTKVASYLLHLFV